MGTASCLESMNHCLSLVFNSVEGRGRDSKIRTFRGQPLDSSWNFFTEKREQQYY